MNLHATHLLNAFLLSVVLTIIFGKIAEPVGLVDRPNGRKIHEGLVPVTGGLAMFIAVIVTILLSGWPPNVQWGLFGGLFILVAVGTVDDVSELPPKLRLAAHIVAALVMVVPGWCVVTELAAIALGAAALPFTVVLIVGTINAYNMLDGLDGLAGGAAAAAFFWLAVLAGLAGNGGQGTVLVLLSATLGFLVLNAPLPWRSKAAAFMGDAGSTMLGASIAFFIVALASGPAPAASLPALLWICAVPMIDTLSLIARRIQSGRSPFTPDRSHLHHLLLDVGLSTKRAAVVVVLVSIALGGIGVAGAITEVPDYVMLVGLLVPVASHAWFVRYARERANEHPRSAQMAPVGETGLPARSPGL